MESGLLPRFFDRVIRQTFGDLVLDDPPAARYLSDLLTRFARAEALRAVQAVAERRLDTVVDSLLAIQSAWDVGSPEWGGPKWPPTPPRRSAAPRQSRGAPRSRDSFTGSELNPSQEDVLRRHIGDYTLFMTGIFREHVEHLAVISYYEHEGRRAYRFVAETARAGGRPEAPLFRRLSDRFEQYAGALSYARKVYFRADAWDKGAWPGDPFHHVFAGE